MLAQTNWTFNADTTGALEKYYIRNIESNHIDYLLAMQQ